MAPLPDIKALVKEHAHRAFILSQMEVLPPGYTQQAWAVHLMGNTHAQLLDRFTRKVATEKARIEALAVEHQDVFDLVARLDGFLLPAIPADPPPELAAKARVVYMAWLGDLVRSECENVLAPLTGKERTVPHLMQAQAQVQEVIQRLTETEGAMPYQVKLTMNKDGTFTLKLTERRGR